MRIVWLNLLAVLGVLVSTAMPVQAQIVIPDINKDTIVKVPPPGGDRSVTTKSVNGGTAQSQPDPRCAKLSDALRRSTPGCQ